MELALELAERSRVVAEARSWLMTPYHHAARIKGAGVDCAYLLIAVFSDLGLIDSFVPAHYPKDWHLHRGQEIYLGTVLQYAEEIDGPPLPGDIVLYRFGRCFAHGGIVLEWPTILHAWSKNGKVLLAEGDKGELAQFGEGERPRRFFRLKRWTR